MASAYRNSAHAFQAFSSSAFSKSATAVATSPSRNVWCALSARACERVMASALGVWVCVSVGACLGSCVLVRELSVCDEVVCGAKGCLCGNGIARVVCAATALRVASTRSKRVEVSVGCSATLSTT